MYNIFPELKEPEDERIRKAILEHIQLCSESIPDRDKWIAWLEKQGEQKPTWSEDDELMQKDAVKFIETGWSDRGKSHLVYWLKSLKDRYTWKPTEKQGEQKPAEWHIEDEQNLNACLGYIPDELLRRWLKDIIHIKYDKPIDKVESKFHEGDWIVYNRNDHSRKIMQIYDIRDNRYYFNDNIHFSWSVKECDEKSHLWTIKDVKDGDVLACKNGWTCIFKSLVNDNLFSSHCFMDSGGWFCEDGGQAHTPYNSSNIHPATKEQRDLLFQKMKEEGYEWNKDKKELIKL